MGRGLPPREEPGAASLFSRLPPLASAFRRLSFCSPAGFSVSRRLRGAPRPGPRCCPDGGERGPGRLRPPPPPPRASPGSRSTWPSHAWAAAAGPSSHAWRSPRASESWTPTGARSRRGSRPGGATCPGPICPGGAGRVRRARSRLTGGRGPPVSIRHHRAFAPGGPEGAAAWRDDLSPKCPCSVLCS